MGDRFFRAFLSEEILSGEGFKSFAEELGMTSGQLQINHSMPRPVMNLELVDDNEIYDRVEIATVSRSHSLSAQTIGGGEQSLCVMSPATAFTGAFARKLSDYPTFKYAYCGLWEDERWQNEHDITQFEGSGRPHEHLPKVDKGGPWGVCIDTSHNPGRRIIATGHIIQSTWRMWFGEAVSFFLPKERLLRFSHASRAEEIGANAVFIELYRDIMDYDSPQSREAQGAFLYWIRCDAMEKFLMKVNPLKGGAIEVDGTECVHGGTRKFIRWVDDKGEPTGEAKADQKFVWETNDEGYYVWRKRKFLNWEH